MSQNEVIAIAATIRTPDFIFEQIRNKVGSTQDKQLAAIAKADAVYKMTVFAHLAQEVYSVDVPNIK